MSTGMANDSRRRATGALTALAATSLTVPVACHAPRTDVTVAAATSLREAMPALVRAYEAKHDQVHVAVTFGASGDLERQVEAGAPVDAVVFAGSRQLDDLVTGGHVDRSTCRTVGSNELVLVGRADGPAATFETLADLPGGESVAVGDPRTVPAGEYARDYLRGLGEWDQLQRRVLFGANVAAVLVYARRGEAALAVVYRTELRGVTDLVVLDTAHGPFAPHPKVVAGAIHGARPASTDFVDFVASPNGSAILASFGFGRP